MASKKIWIGLDGIDCTGKTSIVHSLSADQLYGQSFKAVTFEEFTVSHSGEALRRIISEHRFLSLSNPPSTRWADTFLLMSDWAYKLEFFANSGHELAISDRTFLSIAGYQIARLEQQYPDGSRDAWLWHILEFAKHVREANTVVDCTDVLLTVGGEELQQRVVARGESALTNDQVETLMRAQEIQKKLHPEYVVDTDQKDLPTVIGEIRDLILKEIHE